jgi:catecholate siderophore receptor
VTLPSFTRLDGAAFYAISENLRLQFNVENLLDEEYYASAHSNNNIMPGSPRAYRLGFTFGM